jgi:hypothetical protein
MEKLGMNIKGFGIVLAVLLLLVAPSFLNAAETCDRQCLVDLMKDYLAALVAHDPAAEFPPPGEADSEMAKLGRALAAVPNTCEGQITAGVWAYITEIRNRRLLVIDEQKGLAVGFSNLYHDSKLKTMKLKGIPGVESVPAYQGTFNMPAIHFFKIKKGKIYDIEATGLSLPYGTKTGWE